MTYPTTRVSAPDAEVKASVADRTITGLVLPWGEVGSTGTGEFIFSADSVKIPDDISRVKLLAGHSPDGVPVGVATDAEVRDDGLWMKFAVGSSPAADAALADVSDHVVDRFSVEVVGVRKTGRDVTDSLLKAVALVPFPAFASARADEVTAEAGEPDAPDDEPDDTADDPDDTPTDATDSDESTTSTTPDEKEDSAMTKTARRALAPQGLHDPATTSAKFSMDDAISTILAVRNGEKSFSEIHAELVDITGANTLAANPPQWLGELWSGVVYERRIVPLVTTKALTGRKAIGYRWKTKPTVAKWEANKTPIHSSKAEWETVENVAQPWAGGNDLDRQIFDFNETEIIRAYWEAMAESYAMETDAELAKFLVKNAKSVDESAPDIIRAVARAGIRVDENVHAPATFAIVNPADLETVLDFSQLDLPYYAKLASVADPEKWVTSEHVEKGSAIVGTKTAATFYELPGSPLRAEAEQIAKGGRDAALFGYTAQLMNKPEGLLKVKFAKPVAREA